MIMIINIIIIIIITFSWTETGCCIQD